MMFVSTCGKYIENLKTENMKIAILIIPLLGIIRSFIHQIFIEHLLCGHYCGNDGDTVLYNIPDLMELLI